MFESGNLPFNMHNFAIGVDCGLVMALGSTGAFVRFWRVSEIKRKERKSSLSKFFSYYRAW